MSEKVCAVVGIGPGLGEALARRFAAEGWKVALLSRTKSKLDALARDIGGQGFACDVTDVASIRSGFEAVAKALGPIHTLCWNVGSGVFGDLDKVDVEGMELAWRTNALGLFVAAKAVVPGMRDAGEGNIIVTGATASRRGKPFTTAFAAGKAAQRSLCQSLARQLGPEGIHVSLIVVDGQVAPDNEERIAPSAVADTAMHLATQAKSAWTFELEVRPHLESW